MASASIAASRHVSHIVPETEPLVLVDTFRKVPQGSFVFFLSHFHADHYSGLSSSWSRGVVYCSVLTARLITTFLRVNTALVRGLDLDTEYEVADARVTLLDANHCPGAVMFLCKTKGGKTYLHTGDFRYDRHMVDHPALANCHIDTLFLDTTYGRPEYEFEPQVDTIQRAVNVAEEVCKDNRQPGRVLFLVGSYTIGKEKIALALSETFGWTVFASGKRRRILDCLQLEQLRDGGLGDDPATSCIHIVPMNTIGTVMPYFRPNFPRIQKYMEDAGLSDVFSSVVAFLPTGWSFTSKWNKEHSSMSSGCITVHLLEYSEHSSYTELKEFVNSLRPSQVIRLSPFCNSDDVTHLVAEFSSDVIPHGFKSLWLAVPQIPTVYSNQKDFCRLLRDMQPTTKEEASRGAHISQGNSGRKRTRTRETGNQKQLKITSFFSSDPSVGATEVVSVRKSIPLTRHLQNYQRIQPEVIELSE